MPNPLALPVGPQAARVFFGYRAQTWRPAATDTVAQIAEKRQRFFDELGKTFMPGTPLMQAPLGLAAYLPVVIDPEAAGDIPDEAALIVYASLDVYQATRETSLSRRMYTRAHAAVFDMAASPAAFPRSLAGPATMGPAQSVEVWHASGAAVDWQDGATRFALLTSGGDDLRPRLREAVQAGLLASGCDQIIAACAPGFAALWLHGPNAEAIDAAAITPPGAARVRDLPFQPARVRGDAETGVAIGGASAFNFRFARDLRHFPLAT